MEASRLHLWEVAEELELIGAEIAEAGGVMTPEQESALDDLAGTRDEKIERVALYIRERLVNAEAAHAEAVRLGAIERHHAAAAEGLKGYLLRNMERMGVQRVDTPRVRVRVQKNSRPAIRYTRDPATLPEFLRKTVVQVDGNAAYEQLKAGAPLPDGFVVEVGSHVRIS